MPKVIAFGSIGTLIETSEIQRAAFNSAFQEHNLDWHWAREEYSSLLGQSGGQQRIEAFAATLNADVDAAAIHATKTRIFDQTLQANGVSARAGVIAVVEFAKAQGIKLAFVTSTSADNVAATFQALQGSLSTDDFDFIGDASMVGRSKPAPDIYRKALQVLSANAADVIAIEDSEPSLAAAVAAGIPCIAFPGENTGEQNYDAALTTVSELTPSLF